MSSHTIRQLEERHVAVEIKLLRWNDRMDLLILANIKGEVSLHRLTWQKVWSLQPESDNSHVRDMAWRPDGKIIAIAYSTGNVILVEVENKNILHTIHIEDYITCVLWQQNKSIVTASDTLDPDNKDPVHKLGDASKFVMDLPPLPTELSSSSKSSTENLLDFSYIKNQTDLNILLIGTVTGNLHVSIFGLFTCAVIDVSSYLQRNCRIINAQMSENLSNLYVTVSDVNNNLNIIIIDSSIISTYSEELFAIAMKYVHLVSFLSYLGNTMSAITEAWESILLEMDSKLSKYASNVPEGTVCADFLDLLMFGIPSDEMEEFLMQDLTDKGLKKLGQSIELSYSNIQKLLMKNINIVGQNITYHLSVLRGMARLTYLYKGLGLNEKTVTSAILANGAFLVKGVEVQQVIIHSMSNYKAFFKWLYVVILRLMDEQIPPEIPKMTQQDLSYITEFLQNFDCIGSGTASPGSSKQKNKFNLERLGQYLLDAPLTILPSKETNVWSEFVEENEALAAHDLIVEHNESMSLIQQKKHLEKSIHDIFVEPKLHISNSFHFKTNLICINLRDKDTVRMTQINFNEKITLIAFVDESVNNCGIHFIEINNSDFPTVTRAYLYPTFFSDVAGQNMDILCKVLDVQFYTSSFLSVLLGDIAENNVSYICQIPVGSLRECLISSVVSSDTFMLDTTSLRLNLCEYPGLHVKSIEGMNASIFAVSGTRHVSVVLSDNERKVQLFEMEADEEEDEEETDMTANVTQESESLFQESIVSE